MLYKKENNFKFQLFNESKIIPIVNDINNMLCNNSNVSFEHISKFINIDLNNSYQEINGKFVLLSKVEEDIIQQLIEIKNQMQKIIISSI